VQKLTGKVPKALQDRPTLQPELQIYWDAYRRLSRARLWLDGAPQSITISECVCYCQALRWHHPEFLMDFMDLVQDMDDTFIEHMADKAAKRAAAKTAESDVVT